MVEFASMEPPKKKNPAIAVITGIVLVLLLVGIFAVVRHQRTTAAQQSAQGVRVPGLLRPGNTDFEYYKTKIKIEDVKAVLQTSFNQIRTAKISGTIVNDGDRKLDALELRITLYDVWGKVSRERTAFVLRPKAGFSGKPMEPLEKRRFEIGAESVETNWNPEQVSYEITGLRYE